MEEKALLSEYIQQKKTEKIAERIILISSLLITTIGVVYLLSINQKNGAIITIICIGCMITIWKIKRYRHRKLEEEILEKEAQQDHIERRVIALQKLQYLRKRKIA